MPAFYVPTESENVLFGRKNWKVQVQFQQETCKKFRNTCRPLLVMSQHSVQLRYVPPSNKITASRKLSGSESYYYWQSASQSVPFGFEPLLGLAALILLYDKVLLLHVMGRPPWQVDGSVLVCHMFVLNIKELCIVKSKGKVFSVL
jgi:hypothetical protein